MTTIDKTGGQVSAIMKSLNVGSGVDVDALARNLANAENAARINTITERKASVESRLSGYAIVSSFLSDIKSNFDALKNVSALFQTTATSAAPTSIGVSLTGDAKPGQYGIEIQQLARGSVFQSSGFADKDFSLNAGASFGVQITRADGSVLTVDVTGNDTPAGMVAAINAADVGINAALINKSANGNDWHLVLQGEHGAANDFSITTTAATDMGFDQLSNKLVAAQDAIISVNGLAGITRGSNLITDVIPGASIDLKSEPGQLVNIRIERSGAPMREQVLRLADSYNQMNVVLDELTRASASADDEFTGALRRDMQFVNSLRQQLRDLLTQPSSTPSGGISSLRDVGLSFTLGGKAEVDLGRLDIALASNADAIATMLSGGTDNTSDFASGPKGLAQDASILLKGLLGPQGLINQRKTSGASQISVYERDLVAIEARLEATYSRYILQFAAMESLVERMQGIGNYLKGQFTAMENMYKN
jgi:flagellar hook-associated protein 2